MPVSTRELGWGILGAGGIADTFVTDLAIAGCHVAAVGARSGEAAAAFAGRHHIPRSHAGYADLVADPSVDILYIATPAPFHVEQALLAIGAGKHVLIEKPFALTAVEAQVIAGAARSAGVFAMEAMWARFLPTMVEVRARIADGLIGDVHTVTATHSQKLDGTPGRRQFDPGLAGGALFDLGVYPVSFAHHILGTPQTITAAGHLTERGVDDRVSMLFDHGAGRTALLHTTMVGPGESRATIAGSSGSITLDPFFFSWVGFEVIDGSRPPQRIERWDAQADGSGLRFEALEVESRILASETESEVMPLAESVAVLASLDEIAMQVRAAQPLRQVSEPTRSS